MGGILSCLVSEAACCFGKAACGCACKACGATSSTATRVGYAALLLLSAILSSFMLSDSAVKWLETITFAYVKISCAEGRQCFGVLGVYRICFATTLFHLILSALMYGVQSSRDWRSSVQNGYWAWKLLAWFGFIVLAFVIPNSFFLWWRQYIDLPGAAVFVIIQIILLIDFAYSLTEGLLEKWENNDDQRYLVLLLIITFGAFIGAVVLTGFMYAWFGGASCQLNQFFITFNWMLCVFVTLIGIVPRVQEINPKSGLAQGAMISVYATYLIASAIASEPLTNGGGDGEPKCNPSDSAAGQTERTTMIVGAALTFLAIAYSTSRAATQSNVLSSSEDRGFGDLSLRDRSGGYDAVESGDGDDSKYPADDEKDGVQYSYSFFHIIFALAAMYLAMLLTNWNTISIKDGFASVGKSMAAVWVKVVSSWIVMLLYGWTLIAPLVLPDRQFY